MPLLIVPIAWAALLAMLGAESNRRRLFFVAKPTATLLILVQVAFFQQVTPWPARLPLLAGLALSLVGDVLLMLPGGSLGGGLLAFLLAHLAYVGAFSTRLTRVPPLPALLGLALVVGATDHWITRHAGRMRLPALAYGAAIILTVWTAWGTWNEAPSVAAGLAVAGAVSFLASDILLAVRRFRGPFRGSHALTLGLYYAAQILIIQSFAA